MHHIVSAEIYVTVMQLLYANFFTNTWLNVYVCVCQECDHNLCKPEYNMSIKFKIQLVAMLVTDHFGELYC